MTVGSPLVRRERFPEKVVPLGDEDVEDPAHPDRVGDELVRHAARDRVRGPFPQAVRLVPHPEEPPALQERARLHVRMGVPGAIS